MIAISKIVSIAPEGINLIIFTSESPIILVEISTIIFIIVPKEDYILQYVDEFRKENIAQHPLLNIRFPIIH